MPFSADRSYDRNSANAIFSVIVGAEKSDKTVRHILRSPRGIRCLFRNAQQAFRLALSVPDHLVQSLQKIRVPGKPYMRAFHPMVAGLQCQKGLPIRPLKV